MISDSFFRLHTLARAAMAVGLALQIQCTMAQARSFDVPAQPLAPALAALASQAGLQLAFAPELAEGRQSAAVRGNFEVADALRVLLAGSGLQGRVQGRTLVVERAPQAARSLGEVTVSAQADRSGTTEGTESYTTRATATATGLGLSLRETPQSVSVVTRQQIEDQGYITAKDALDSVTGVYGNDWDTKRTYYYACGFSIDRVSFDGVVTNDGSGGIYGENAQDLAFYDRVEIVRGATGLLTGAGEPSATVNYVRKRADSKTFQGSARLSLGSWSNRRAEVDLSTPLTSDGRVRGRLVAVAQDKESHLDFYKNKKQGIYGTIEADLTPRTKLSVGADYTRDKIDGATWGGLPVLFSDGTATNLSRSKNEGASWTYWNSTIKSAFVDVEHRFDNGWSLKGSLTQVDKNYQSKLVLPYDLYGTGLDSSTGAGLSAYSWMADDTHKQTTGSLQASGPFSLLGRRHELIVGYSANRRHSHTYNQKYAIEDIADYRAWDGSYAEPSWTDYPDTSITRTRENALYAAARLSLADPLKVIIGGRHTEWRSTADGTTRSHSAFAPYVGALYDLGRDHSLYASYTEIFNPQNYRDASGNYLDPVTGKNYEVGVKGEYLDGRLNASLAVFRTLQDNVATADGTNMVAGTSDQAYRAASGVKSRGFEAELSGQLLPQWNLTAGISRTIVRDQYGAEFNPYMPKTLFKLGTSYRLPGAWSKLTVGGNLKWQNATHDDFSFAASGASYRYGQGAFAMVGLMARYAFTPSVSLQVNVNNLFDKTYWAYYASNSGTYGAPRNLLATLTYRY
ncbi:TonB-dependent siderophore receptor [Xylophilus sp.]|uniref:TonB-dependent siderophore receptor n=1 Tax=Xylophilus sp. TaxID=2653893 RepID=UPI0013BBE44D|nr:TonB-dependent siderophore receptor [Xylophilus sp.]KAF1049784.1 MAG: Ferripyoverdine receptor [Xylophilus sp.]